MSDDVNAKHKDELHRPTKFWHYVVATLPMPALCILSLVLGVEDRAVGQMSDLSGLAFAAAMLSGLLIVWSLFVAATAIFVFPIQRLRRKPLPKTFGLHLAFALSTFISVAIFWSL